MSNGNEAILQGLLAKNFKQIAKDIFEKFVSAIQVLKSELPYDAGKVMEIIEAAIREFPLYRINPLFDLTPKEYENPKWEYGERGNLDAYSAVLTCGVGAYLLHIYIPCTFQLRKKIIAERIQSAISACDLELAESSNEEQLKLVATVCTNLTHGKIMVTLITDENDPIYAGATSDNVQVYAGEQLIAKYWRDTERECQLLVFVPDLDLNPPMTKRLLRKYNIGGNIAKTICRGILPDRVSERTLLFPEAYSVLVDFIRELFARGIASQPNIARKDGSWEVEEPEKTVLAAFDKEKQELLVYIP